MRTLQEKYNAIQEGKFSKDHFLAEARMQQPQLVTRFNGYDDAVQILKNKGMIVEAAKENPVKTHMEKLIQAAKTGDKKKESILAGFSGAGIKYKVTAAEPNVIKYWNDEQGLKGEIELKETVNEAKQPKATKKGLADYRYKPTNEMDKYPYEQILRGIRVELEVAGVFGTPTAEEYAKALAKVSKNLAKDSIFYTNQVAGVNPKVDLHDKMVPVTAKNSVDTFNGMKKAALKEGFKKLIKKVLSEEVMDVESYKEDEVYEMYGEDDMDESAMGDVYLLAQESDSFEQFVQAIEQEYGPTSDVDELMYIWDNRQESGIDYDDENFSDPLIDGDLDENKYAEADAETDRKFILKLMGMYEYDPSKYENLHREAEMLASTESDPKYKHMLGLIEKAKEKALQSLSNQDKRQADSEGMDEDLYEGKKSLSQLLK